MIDDTLKAVETTATELAPALTIEGRAQHFAEAETHLRSLHPLADDDAILSAVAAVDEDFARKGEERIRQYRRDLQGVAAAVRAGFVAAQEPPTVAAVLEEQAGGPTKLTLADRQSAQMLEELRFSRFRAEMQTMTFADVLTWYRGSEADLSVVRFVEQQAKAGFPLVAKTDPARQSDFIRQQLAKQELSALIFERRVVRTGPWPARLMAVEKLEKQYRTWTELQAHRTRRTAVQVRQHLDLARVQADGRKRETENVKHDRLQPLVG